jgi:MATE family multidrug resistance protein
MNVTAELKRPRSAHGETRPWRDEVRATLTLAWPIVATNLAQMAIGTTEVVLLGWYSPEAMAAGVLGVNLFYAFMMIGIGIATGCSPMLAQAIGRKHRVVRDLRRTVRQGFWLTTAIAVIAWIPLWHTEAIFLAMGQAPEMAAGAGDYMRVMQWGMLPFFWYMVLRAFVSARERPRAALVVTLLSILLNAVLGWALIFGRLGAPELGLIGAGIAASITETFMFLGLAAFIAVDRQFRRHYLAGRFWRPDWPRLAELARIGGPIAGALLFEVGVFNAAVFIMGLIDVDQLAAHAIAIQIASLTFMVPMGIANAATVRVGLAAGGGIARASVAPAGSASRSARASWP